LSYEFRVVTVENVRIFTKLYGGLVFKSLLTTRVIATLAVLGVAGVAQLVGPGAMAAPPAGGHAVAAPYPASVVTNTDLRLAKKRVRPGERNTARVRVTSDAGTPQGTVTFRVSGHAAKTVRLVQGRASYSMPRDLKAGKTYRVTARYNGKRIWKPSKDTEYVKVRKARGEVAGSEGERDESRDGSGSGTDDGSANRSAPTQGEVQGAEAEGALPNVGSDTSTTVAALLGLGLLAAGGLALVMRRRRVS
jgi:LPXTG-motif cell wall-anchored protein